MAVLKDWRSIIGPIQHLSAYGINRYFTEFVGIYYKRTTLVIIIITTSRHINNIICSIFCYKQVRPVSFKLYFT